MDLHCCDETVPTYRTSIADKNTVQADADVARSHFGGAVVRETWELKLISNFTMVQSHQTVYWTCKLEREA